QVGDRRGLGYSLSGLACLAFAQENLQEAARLFGVVDSIRNDLGNLLEEILQAEYDHAKSVTRKLLGEETYHTAWFEGENLVLDQLLHSFLNQENSS
ncbi:MAG: hypothetical protein GWN30_36500, partial [Gammaproteobacteria bacterium]|nr:hypothetical protein [Gammaproteobacteria bacterium]